MDGKSRGELAWLKVINCVFFGFRTISIGNADGNVASEPIINAITMVSA